MKPPGFEDSGLPSGNSNHHRLRSLSGKYEELRYRIIEPFRQNGRRYGYRLSPSKSDTHYTTTYACQEMTCTLTLPSLSNIRISSVELRPACPCFLKLLPDHHQLASPTSSWPRLSACSTFPLRYLRSRSYLPLRSY